MDSFSEGITNVVVHDFEEIDVVLRWDEEGEVLDDDLVFGGVLRPGGEGVGGWKSHRLIWSEPCGDSLIGGTILDDFSGEWRDEHV